VVIWGCGDVVIWGFVYQSLSWQNNKQPFSVHMFLDKNPNQADKPHQTPKNPSIPSIPLNLSNFTPNFARSKVSISAQTY